MYKAFPDQPRDTNDFFYMYALALLMRIEKENLSVNWLPQWLSSSGKDIHAAIKHLIELCLTHFNSDQARKTILLAANCNRRLLKIFSIIFPYQKQIADMQHLLTRYGGLEFDWGQILSSPKRNILIELDRLCMLTTLKFVDDFRGENHTFNENLAKQELQRMLNFEENILSKTPNYLQMLKESDYGEVNPTEASGVVYDNFCNKKLRKMEKVHFRKSLY